MAVQKTGAYMSAKDIATELGVSADKARGLILARMPHMRVGRNEFRVKRSDFDAFCEASTVPPIYKS